jgi:hypothetical protein
MNHRLRVAMKFGTIDKITGECEADETGDSQASPDHCHISKHWHHDCSL